MVNKCLSPKEKTILENITGERFIKYRCDEFLFNNWAYGQVSLFIDDYVLLIKVTAESQDYFGAKEEICNISIESVSSENDIPVVSSRKQIDVNVSQTIKEVCIVNEIQTIFKNDVQEYEYSFVRAIIIVLADGREISFEKTDVFSEEIAVTQGYNLTKELQPISEKLDGWDDCYSCKVIRTEEILKAK